jgi:hypothetical protein
MYKNSVQIILLLIITAIVVFSDSVFSQQNPYKAPLYWSVYEHHIVKEQNGVEDNYIPESEFLANINWVNENLKAYGYNMICVDGWGDVSITNENGYRTTHSRHWQHDFEWWADYLDGLGMTLGMYGNPLWIHKEAAYSGATIVGTDLLVEDLIDESEESLWFTWVQVDRPGAEEYVKGYIQYYADMGIKYFRVDFLSWFESGYDRNLGDVGPARPKEQYETALRWMREACDSNDMFLSLVMPNLFNDAEIELNYGHMTRINEDTGYGEWWKFSDKDRGYRYNEWSQYANAFDGFIYWSKISGRDKIKLDGDFLRLNTFETDAEKRSVISLNLIAGGPVTISDQYNTIGNDIWLYQNEELLALNKDGFVGKPLSNDPLSEMSQTWFGQLTNGEWIVGLFNREKTIQTRVFNFSQLGVNGALMVRDLWQHNELGIVSEIEVNLAPHSSLILNVSNSSSNKIHQTISFDEIPDRDYSDGDFELSATSSSGLPVKYEVALGPAEMIENKVHLKGQSGNVFITAYQGGDEQYFAAIPAVRSFNVSGGHQQQIYIAGTFTDWSLSIEMELIDEIWKAENVSIPTGNHELKFANTNDWSGDDWGNAIGLSGIAQRTTGGAPNISFGILVSGEYDIYFDDQKLQYSIGNEITSLDMNPTPVHSFTLNQNYPNPFNPSTTIEFSIPNTSFTSLIIYDVLGRTIETLVNETMVAGKHYVIFDGENLSNGIYYYQLETNNKKQTKKMILLK